MRSEALERVFESTLTSMLGPIAPYLSADDISEVLVNGPLHVYAERGGRLELQAGVRFDDAGHLAAACRTLAQFVGKRFVDTGCRIDGRLPDGSRVHILHGPGSRCGTLVSIRRFGGSRPALDDLVRWNSLTPEAADYLRAAVRLEKNIVISGSTGTGKTTMLSALASLLDEHLRILVLEDANELDINRPHVVYLETRAADEHGEGQMTMRDLLHSSLRLRGDRLILGEVRGPEALELIQALTSGHGGSFSTLHASSPETVVGRLETLALLGMPSLSTSALRRQICSAIDVVVQLVRTHSGRRRVSCIAEITGVTHDGRPAIGTLFDIAADGPARGELVWTRTPSHFTDDLRRGGHDVPTGCGPFVAGVSPAALTAGGE